MQKPSMLNSWWIAIRPHTLPAAISPVIVAASITIQKDSFLLIPALMAIICALMLQISSNLVNDVMDSKLGADNEERHGFERVTQAGLLSSKEVWAGTIFVLLIALITGFYFVWLRGPWIILIGVVSIISSIAYTAGPFPLAYNGYGDIFVLIFFGFVNLCGSVYVIMGSIPDISWLMAFNMGALITAILVVNNIRDIDSDKIAGRKNIPIVFGLKAAVWEYRILLTLPYLILIVTAVATTQFWILLPLLTLSKAMMHIKNLDKLKGKALNSVLGGHGSISFIFWSFIGNWIYSELS